MIESMQASPVARVIISISAMLFAGFAMTRITKRFRLPNVTGYILAGILMGPCCLNVIPQTIIDGTDFLSDVALAFIAFSAGEFFKVEVLRRNGAKVIVITVLEACLASVAVFILVYGVLHLELSFSIVLSALASATAPASTMMTIRQTGAHGDFVDTLLQVVALDDVVGLILYSVAISVAMASQSGSMQLSTVIAPILANICVLALGALFGVMLKLFFRKRSTDNRLIVSIATLFAFCGICAMADVSPLLGCMSMGMTYINLTGDEKLFRQLGYWSPPILLLFFVRSGLSFNLGALTDTLGASGSVPLLLVGILYFAGRIVGKYAGAYLGALAVGKGKGVRNYLGLALIPKAGVAIGLAAMGARTLGGEMGVNADKTALQIRMLNVGKGAAVQSLRSQADKNAYHTQMKKTLEHTENLSILQGEAAEILTDKAKMKDAFRQGGVSAADGMRVRSAEEAQKAAEQLGYPVVVKRVDSSGSRGITVVEHSGQIEEAYENARNGSARDYVLVEKFLRGTEIGVDGFVQNHKLVFLAPHTKFVYRGAHTTVPVGHAFPYGCSGALREEIARQMQLAVTASGADQCSVNADVFVDGEKVWIIEMGGRTGATCIPELISTYYGFDFYEQMIKSALGEETDFQQTESCPCMAKLLLSPVSGTITQIDRDQVERLRQEGLELVLDYPEGHEVSAMADGTDRIGHVIVKTDREAELDEQMKRVYRCIWIDGKNLETIWEEKTAK